MGLIKNISLVLLVGIASGQKTGFVGNSITQEGYGDIVKTLMPQLEIFNFGVGGITVEGYKTTNRYQDVLNTHPDITIILLGTNDWRYYTNRDENWRENWHIEYQSLINTFNIWSDVYVGTIPYQVWSSEPDEAIEGMNARIRGMTNKKGVIDFNNVLNKNPDYFKDDGVHPNENGQNAMAIAVWLALSVSNSIAAPDTPKNLQAVARNGQITLSWDANTESDLSKYFLFRGTVEGGATTGIKTFAKYYTSYIDTAVINGTTYYYQIAAGDLLDHRSKKSDQVSATPSQYYDNVPPNSPTITSTSVGQNSILIHWNGVDDSDLDHYNIYRSTISDFNPEDSDQIYVVEKYYTEFSDSNSIEPNTPYFYKMTAVDTANNESIFSNQASITTLYTFIDYSIKDFSLHPNYPNPFNPNTNINFSIPFDSNIEITVFDVLGRKITELLNEFKVKGTHTVKWNGRDNIGQLVNNGVYFYRIQAGDFTKTRKMLMMK